MPISEVYNIDCLEYMRGLPDKFFDLAIADPPYGGAGNQQLTGGGADSVNGSTDTSQSRQSRFRGQIRKIQCSRTGGTWAAKFGRGG